MAYQYRGSTRPRPSGQGGNAIRPKHNWVNKTTRESRRRDRMLDKSRENYFKYDMEDLLRKGNVPDDRRLSLAATLFAKGSRGTVQDAKDFALEKFEEGIIDEPTYKSVLNLIEGYSVWR